jgi:hypothetical protein
LTTLVELESVFTIAANCLDKLAIFFRNSSDMKATIPPVLVALSLACFAFSPGAQAVSPPPDGGYPGGNTAEGQDALLHLTTGVQNTAVGFLSLKSNTTSSYNTAIGSGTQPRACENTTCHRNRGLWQWRAVMCRRRKPGIDSPQIGSDSCEGDDRNAVEASAIPAA